MKALTDYPDLQKRRIEILDYDHNKYATVLLLDTDGIELGKPPYDMDFYEENGEIKASIKTGYIYRSARKRNFQHETLGRHFKE